MSDDLYATRARWFRGSGAAKLYDKPLPFDALPADAPWGEIDGLDYAPLVDRRDIMPRGHGWRRMTREETIYLDRLLRSLYAEKYP